MEKWMPIQGTKNLIEVSNKGRFRSFLRGDGYILKAQTDAKGYQRVTVSIDAKKKTYKVHREVAKAFLPNPHNLPQVNHKDGNKTNNRADNLEWVTNAENAYHALKSGLWASVIEGARRENQARKKPIIAYRNIEGKTESLYFSSISDAESVFESRHICDVLKGNRKHVKGWMFRYASVGGDANA